MALREIVAAATGDANDAQVFAVAAAVAAGARGELRVIPAFADPAAAYAAYGLALSRAPEELIERVRASEHEVQERIEMTVRAAANAKGVGYVVERRALAPVEALAAAAVLADLACFAGEAVRGPLSGLFAHCLLAARAPMLLVNRDGDMSRVAIAWDGSPQAGRAVRAAIPLLAQASSVRVITNSEDAATGASSPGPERLSAYLALHGIANPEIMIVGGENVAASLLAATKEGACNLLVAGAYGRPRLSELVLGGTTRALVNAKHGPNLLLAH